MPPCRSLNYTTPIRNARYLQQIYRSSILSFFQLQSFFTNPGLALGIARPQEIIDVLELESWVTHRVGLTVAHEREDKGRWDAILPLAWDAGVMEPVIAGIAGGTAPRGLLPKDGIWVQFTLDVLRGSMEDSTWQATTHLVGDQGAVGLAFTACYFDMITRLNRTFESDVC